MDATDDPTGRTSTRRRRLGILGAVVGLAIAVVAVLALVSSPKDATPTVTVTATAGDAVPGQAVTAALLDGVPQHGRTLGRSSAPVTLVEFADLQCPFCREFTVNALPTVVRDYVRTGEVRLEFRPRAFLGADSVTAARTVLAAGRQDKLWNVLDLLYATQGAEESGWVTQPLLDRTVKAAGADPAKARAAARTAAVTGELRAADLLAARNGLDGTPAFLLGPTGGTLRPLNVTALTGAAFASALDAALKR
jgi:protein-disulfide isomerase